VTEIQLKNRIGFFIIISHFTTISLVVILYFFGGFLFEEMTTAIALIIPMFSIYTSAIIKKVILNRNCKKDSSRPVNKEYVFIVYFIPFVFVLFIVSLILLKAFNLSFVNFEQFKIMLAVSETAFGTYVGLVLSSLFEIKESKGTSSSEVEVGPLE